MWLYFCLFPHVSRGLRCILYVSHHPEDIELLLFLVAKCYGNSAVKLTSEGDSLKRTRTREVEPHDGMRIRRNEVGIHLNPLNDNAAISRGSVRGLFERDVA